MLVLSIDTSTLQGSVGWIQISPDDDSKVDAFAECAAPSKPGHAETLIDRIETVLSYGGHALEDVGLVVFGKGPGTFTGLRIGLSTVKGIAVANGCPVKGVSSLEAFALSPGLSGQVVSVIDARRGELFTGLYQVEIVRGIGTATAVIEEMVGKSEEVVGTLTKHIQAGEVFLTGDTHALEDALADALPTGTRVLPGRSQFHSAFVMARAGHARFLKEGPDNLDGVVPNYLREPDAKLPKD